MHPLLAAGPESGANRPPPWLEEIIYACIAELRALLTKVRDVNAL